MVTIAKIKQLIVLPTEFVSSWEEVGDHKDINGYLAADLSKCTNFNLNFHGAASTWLMQTFNPEKIGTDETIIAKCTSKIEKNEPNIETNMDVDEKDEAENISSCSSSIEINHKHLKTTEKLPYNKTKVVYKGPTRILNEHNCSKKRNRDELLGYFTEIVKYAHETNFCEALRPDIGFVINHHLYLFSHCFHKKTQHTNNWACDCQKTLLDNGITTTKRSLMKAAQSKNSLDTYRTLCKRNGAFAGDGKKFHVNGMFDIFPQTKIV